MYYAIGFGRSGLETIQGVTMADALNNFVKDFEYDPKLILTQNEYRTGRFRVTYAIEELKRRSII